MGLNASELLGASEVAGVKVNPRGLGKAIMSRSMVASPAGGILGAAVQAVGSAAVQEKMGKGAAKQKAEAAASTAPAFKKIAWLAATDDDIALVEVDARTTLKFTGEVLARVPRQQVTSVELGKSKPMIAAPITVTFTDGQQWIFEVPAPSKGGAKKFAAVFG
jgi:hypothetical protein